MTCVCRFATVELPILGLIHTAFFNFTHSKNQSYKAHPIHHLYLNTIQTKPIF